VKVTSIKDGTTSATPVFAINVTTIDDFFYAEEKYPESTGIGSWLTGSSSSLSGNKYH